MTTPTQARANLDVACHLNVLVPDASIADLPAALDMLADAGYSRVVLPPLDPSATDAPAIARLFADRGLAPITIAGGQAPGADVSSEDADERAAGAALLRSVVDLTVAAGRRPDERRAVRRVRPAGRAHDAGSRGAIGARSRRRCRLRARPRHHDDLRGAQPIRDLAGQHRRSGSGLRRAERIGSSPHPSRHLPHGRRGGGHLRRHPRRASEARLPRARPVRARDAEHRRGRRGRRRAQRARRRLSTAGGASRRSPVRCCPLRPPTCWRSGALRTTMERSLPPMRCGSSIRDGPAAPWGVASSDCRAARQSDRDRTTKESL